MLPLVAAHATAEIGLAICATRTTLEYPEPNPQPSPALRKLDFNNYYEYFRTVGLHFDPTGRGSRNSDEQNTAGDTLAPTPVSRNARAARRVVPVPSAD